MKQKNSAPTSSAAVKLAKRSLGTVAAAIAFGLTANVAQAATYTEDFEAPFPAWESGWLGMNSNLNDYYCGVRGCAFRGNNPDGIWPAGVGQIIVDFTPAFGASLTSLSLDVAGYVPTNLLVFDSSSSLIFSQNVALTFGAYTDPGVYSSYSITSSTGISRFEFDSSGASGNTSIDNVVVSTNAIPEPETYAMLLAGLGLLGFMARRRKNLSV